MFFVQRKLKSETGMSIFYALLLMIVAVFIVSVLLGVSTTAVKRVVSDRADTQAHATLDSAAKAVATEYDGASVSVKTVTKYLNGEQEGDPAESVNKRIENTAIVNALAAIATKTESSYTGGSFGSFAITATASEGDVPAFERVNATFERVNATVNLLDNGTVEIRMSLDNGNYAQTVRFSTSTKTTTDTRKEPVKGNKVRTVTTVTKKATLKNPVIVKAGA